MFKLLVQKLPFSISLAGSLIKEISVLPPPKNLLLVLPRIMSKFQGSSQFPILKKQIVRALNTTLCRTPKTDFPITFQHQFPSFLKENLKDESNDIFKLVPLETKEELKKGYERFKQNSMF